MKTLFEINKATNDVNIITISDEIELLEGPVARYVPVPEGSSTLAIRYAVDEAGNVVDTCPGKTDEEVLELVKLVVVEEQNNFELVYNTKLNEIRNFFNNLIEGLKKDAADYEVQTWEVQQLEYSSWVRDNAYAAPYLSAMAAARGITLEVLMQKVGAKVVGMATVQGKQHALEDMLKAAETVSDILSIKVEM